MIGERIKDARMKVGLNQTELADKIAVSKQTLYKYETGIITNVPSDKIERIADVCRVSPSYLMGWDINVKRVFYQRIRTLREEKGISQESLARMVGYTDPSIIEKMETGQEEVPQSKVFAFARALQVPPTDLMLEYTIEMETDRPAHKSQQEYYKHLSYKAMKIAEAYENADERTKIAVEVALGIGGEDEV